MIYGQLAHGSHYANLGERIEKALAFITQNPLSQMPDQRIELDGERLFATLSTYETKPVSEMALEAHRRYIDLQYVFEGEERIFCAFLDEMHSVTTPYDPQKDIVFFQGSGVPLVLRPDRFLLLWPEDVHAPGVFVREKGKVRKAVVKILLD